GVAVDEELTPTPPPATSAPPATVVLGPTPAPDISALLADGGVALIATAYDRLLDQYINPVQPSTLLDGAWTSLVQQAAADDVEVPPKPAFTDERAGDFELFRQAYVRMAEQAEDATQLRYAAIRGMAASLQDCHTFFLSPVASDTLIDTRAGAGAVGIGVELAGVPPLVTEVIQGSPADDAGVRVGDYIHGVDGHDLTQSGPASAFDLINGEDGTEVTLSIFRAGELLDVTATRARVVPKNVETRIYGETGYVRVRNFVDSGIAGPLRDALEGFEAQGVTRWVIDMRGNPGGRHDPYAIGLFVKEGVVARDRNRAGEVHEDVATGDALALVRPTVVLANNRTGSVAEVFVAALQEYGVAHVIGAKTNGCVGYTDIQPLGDGSSLAVTTHVNLGPVSGAVLHGVGVIPDQEVPRTAEDIAAARDPQLDAALAYFGETVTTPR
ncbi:MAG TPA: S41 family peptidase, partial [Dehalococcoidia bacterium]|nr:S41 family peptidase [Dehalococcoidia bacterium]